MLVNRNIHVDGHRTSIRLEPEFWSALADIAQRERVTINQLCTEVDRGAGNLSRTAAIRVFITTYMVRLSQRAAEQPRRPMAAVARPHEGFDDYPVQSRTIVAPASSGQTLETTTQARHRAMKPDAGFWGYAGRF